MFAPYFNDPCNYCAGPAVYLLVYLDDAAGLPVCLDHFGHGYQLAEQRNELSFLPVSISRVDSELVTA